MPGTIPDQNPEVPMTGSNLIDLPPKHPVTVVSVIGNTVRGGLVGLAELVPGVSGGTVALIVGIYERVVESGHHVVSGLRHLVTGPDRWKGFLDRAGRAEWGLLLPLVVGMFATVFLLAGTMSSFVTDHPVAARALFGGMVLASVAVPLLMIDRVGDVSPRRRVGEVALVVLAAGVAFWLTGLGSAEDLVNPHPVVVFLAAAVAVCALVLPGISGSFFLLAVGLYAVTTRAVDDLDVAYILVFAAGALFGLISFVQLVHWLLRRHHTATMLAMSGLMLGSLRALWPWQAEGRQPLPPGDDWLPMLGLAALGAALVVVLTVVDQHHKRRVAVELIQEEIAGGATE